MYHLMAMLQLHADLLVIICSYRYIRCTGWALFPATHITYVLYALGWNLRNDLPITFTPPHLNIHVECWLCFFNCRSNYSWFAISCTHWGIQIDWHKGFCTLRLHKQSERIWVKIYSGGNLLNVFLSQCIFYDSMEKGYLIFQSLLILVFKISHLDGNQ